MSPRTPRPPAPSKPGLDLADLRRAGRTTELLVLYELAIRPPSRLKSLASTLGISVQGVSLVYRDLSRRGEVALGPDGRYRLTVTGIAALHAALTTLGEDLDRRRAHLQVVRTCRALAGAPLREGDRVVLAMSEGRLVANPGVKGTSRGRAVHAADEGDLVEVTDLEGIVELGSGSLLILVLPARRAREPGALKALRTSLKALPSSLIAAEGLEAEHLVGKVPAPLMTRFGASAAAREAARLGLDVTVVVTDERLPGLLGDLSEAGSTIPLEIRPLRWS